EATLDDNPFRYCGEYYDKETKTIYLRARYYNAEQARFTQEDPIRDGYNWYSYCGGNPVNFIDPTGYAVASCFGDIPDLLGGGNDVLSYGLCGGGDGSANNSVTNYGYATEPTIPEFIEEPIDGTYSVGLCGSASWSHIGINGQIGLSFDAKGNVAIQGSVSLEVTTSSDAAVNGGVYQTITNAPDITKLEDQGSAFGTTISVPIKGPLALNAGTDVNIIPDEEADTYYWGLTSVRGIGYSPKPSAEAHFSHGTTKTLVSFNIFKIWDDIYNGK
ncbi:MAG: RHS repeat-associated core domain-containing protein, partial [Clostridia bacterium]|nr:RHS repeat-associated core domain-containing protein [Clostridia bacterium]